MKRSIAFMLFFCMVTCYAQVPKVEIKKENSCLYGRKDNFLFRNLNYIITNDGDTPIWLWFSREDVSLWNDYQKIRQYFLIPKGDGSYYQWMCDGNVDTFTQSLFYVFAKIIQPKENFYISFICQDADVLNMESIIDAHLNIVSEEELLKQCPGVEDKRIKKQFTFHPSVVAIPWDSFVEELR